ncbi:MAG: AAA family ATPase [Micropepsaceae bacterium]
MISVEVQRPPDLGGGAWKLSRLTTIVAIFGKNGSGKSRLLRAWRDQNPEQTHYVVPERTGDIDYQPGFLQQQLDYRQRRDNSARNFVEGYRRQIVARIQAYFAARGDHRGTALPAKPDELEAYVSLVLPDFTVALSGTKNPPYVLTRASDGTEVRNVDQLSSGEAQLITLALDVLTIAAIWELSDQQSRIMLVDEPDAHIHPDLQVRFADFLVRVTDRYKLQTVVASHSTTLLAALGQFGAGATSVLYLDRTKNEFGAQPYTDVLRELAACLGGHALMGPLFGVPMLLVEGDDDYRLWSQVPRYHQTSFSVIPCGGSQIKKYQKSLEQILGVLRDDATKPSGYALLDGDVGRPQPNADTPQKHVPFIQLTCFEIENLYLCDEVLASLSTTWGDAQQKIVKESGRYGAKAAKLASAASWVRDKEDVKAIINELSEILDDKRVHWTLRVAKVLGSAKPSGQLAAFLGPEVVGSLWP